MSETVKTKTYRISFRTECYVEAKNEDDALQKFENGEGENEEYVEFLSIELSNNDCNKLIPNNKALAPPQR